MRNRTANLLSLKPAVVVFTKVAMLLLSMTGNCLADPFVRIKMYPEHVGVFTTVRKQQFIAFGIKADGSAVNITKQVDWKSSNNGIVTIDEKGLATVVAGRTLLAASGEMIKITKK